MIVECRLLIFASLCVLQLACTVANAQPPGPPNILFLMTDNQRWDALGSAGNSIIQTPNLDRLAAEGVRFENMFTTAAICAASRASILTGQYRRTHGYTFNTPPLSRQAMAKSYPALLREAGYRTGFIGKFGIETESGAIGDMFDFYSYREAYGTSSPYFRQQPDGTTRHVTRLNGDDAVAFLQSTTPDQPFALSVSFSAPHPEDDNPDQYIYDTAYEDLYQNDTIPPANVSDPVYFDLLPDFIQDSLGRDRWFQRFDTPEKYQRMIKSMYRMITGVDEQVGRIRDELERLALDDNTVVIFTSDNGMMVGEHGLTGIWLGYEPSIRAPLIISDPRLDAARQGSQVDQMALNIDLPATMLELAGVDIPEEVQGSSLQPLLAGEPTPWRTDFFYEHLFEHPRIPKSEGVRNEQWKYLRYFQQDPGYEQLFDLQNDPHEVNNLAGDPLYAQTLADLRSRTDQLLAEVRGDGLADTFPLPTSLRGAEGNTSSRAPLHRDPLREQDVYGSSDFPSAPLTITEIRYRRDSTFTSDHSDAYTATFNAGDIEIRMSTTSQAVDGLSMTFAENIGPDELLVHDGPLTITSTDMSTLSPKPQDIVIPLETPFEYDPSQGNLLVDIKIFNDLGLGGIEHDAHDVAGDSVSRVLFISGINGATANPNAPVANLVQSAGPVTEFVFDLAGFELGDFNFDSLVDVVDYRILRDHMLGHLEGPVSYSNGDIDKDWDVDLSDFKQFQALFPEVVAAAERVPEPSSMALLSIIATLMLASQRRLDFGGFESYKEDRIDFIAFLTGSHNQQRCKGAKNDGEDDLGNDYERIRMTPTDSLIFICNSLLSW